MNNRSTFTISLWAACLFVLPLIVYAGAAIANHVGLPFDTGCLSYAPETGALLSLFVGIPYATAVTVLSALGCLEKDIAFKVWTGFVSIVFLALAIFVIYHSDRC